jgi:hypothetical protein
VTAGLDDERRKDRDENRQLWRDTQRQINELAVRMNDLFAEESHAADRQLGDRIKRWFWRWASSLRNEEIARESWPLGWTSGTRVIGK